MKLQAYEKKERETLQQLRLAPFGMWLEFLREERENAEEMNATWGSARVDPVGVATPWLVGTNAVVGFSNGDRWGLNYKDTTKTLFFMGFSPKTKDNKWVPGWLYILHLLLQDEMMRSMTCRKQNFGPRVSCGFKTTK